MTKSVAFGSSRRHLSVSRLLSSQIMSFRFDFDIDVTCPDTGCNVESITSAMQETVSQIMTTSIENDELLAQLEDETNAAGLLSGAITLDTDDEDSASCTCPTSSVSETDADNATSLSSAWYPVWGTVDKCSDGPGMPLYMQGNSHYLTDCE